MSNYRWLFWHRKDLRINDNIGLKIALSNTSCITGVFILDPSIFKEGSSFSSLAESQAWFIEESLIELKKNWQRLGSELIILFGDSVTIIPLLIEELRIDVFAWNHDVEPQQISKDKKITDKLKSQGCQISVQWDQLLVNPEDLKNQKGNPYKVYGPFYRQWEQKISIINQASEEVDFSKKIMSVKKENPIKFENLDLENCNNKTISILQNIHQRKNLYFQKISPCQPGELAASVQLKKFCTHGNIFDYSKSRDIPSNSNTSKISAALRFGTISPRQAWLASEKSLEIATNEIEKRSIFIWKKELAWREFYQHALFHFPKLANKPFRKIWENFPWENKELHFNSWCKSHTGIPIIDAAMRELTQSGWMHNRCRMIVASFLVKDLICDWRLGEAFFMSQLVDGDLASNNGGWQWAASSGMDPKPLRIFNPYLQAQKFDPNANYIRKWLPEISHVSTADLISGEITPIERRGYPKSIVNHKVQQYKFKKLYANIRESESFA